MKFLDILKSILGVAEEVEPIIVPIFVHNPKTQQLIGASAATVNTAIASASAGGSAAKVAATLIGTAESNIIPLVIHNPQTGQVSAVIATTAEGILQSIGNPAIPPPPTTAP